MPLLDIHNLRVEFGAKGQAFRAVDGLDIRLGQGQVLGIVGESGSGKSVAMMALMGLLAGQGRVSADRLQFDDKDLLTISDRQRRRLLGKDMAMIFQDPMTSLNPSFTVGFQIEEVLREHMGLRGAAARSRAIELLQMVEIPGAASRLESYPHQFSGGMAQRVMIAIAIACNPKLLIADEPTTALDVTIQVQILELLNQLQREEGMAVLMITHDLNLVKSFADRVGVMQQGRLIETAATTTLFSSPREDYTQRLLSSHAKRMVADEVANPQPLLEAKDIRCRFFIKQGWFRQREFVAVDRLDLSLARGETLGIVGESGSGKSTLGMALLRLSVAQSDGAIRFDGQAISDMNAAQLRPLRARMQVVFQDPFASLSPRRTIEQIVVEGLQLHQPQWSRAELRDAVAGALTEVGLSPAMMTRYPHEFSGGQRQRIAIARALVLKPALILLDEPTSSLDVSVQYQVLELLAKLQEKYGMAYLFISHDLAVIRAMAHRVIVMKDGKVVESGPTAEVLSSPREAYTQRLLAAARFATAA